MHILCGLLLLNELCDAVIFRSFPAIIVYNLLRRVVDVYLQLFRKDLISAMKLPDTEVLQYDEYFLIADTWKLEWERGVQVPVEPDAIPPLVVQSVTYYYYQ